MKWQGLPVVVGLVYLQACTKAPTTGTAEAAQVAVAVSEVTVHARVIPTFYTATGVVRARIESQLASQLMAKVLAVNVQVSDRVRAGQVLIKLDTQASDAADRKAKAALAESQLGVAAAESSIAGAKASLDLAAVTAQRMNDLYEKKSISKQELDEATAKLKTAGANYAMARARREQLNERISQGNAGVAQSQVESDYAFIRAPFAGTITARNIEPGMIATPGKSLLTMQGGSGYRIHINVEEAALPSVKLGETVSVWVDRQQEELTGRVGEISPDADAGSHSYTAKIDCPAVGHLHAGQFARARFQSGSKEAITAPLNAVTQNGQLETVFVDEGGVARLRLVTLGQKSETEAQVLSGLRAGERVISPVPFGLADGAKIEARP